MCYQYIDFSITYLFMKNKIKISTKLSRDLEFMCPETKDKFMCPACLKLYRFDDAANISDAHIIPKAAGGKELTLLCTPCNSKFGNNQDRWFGEWLILWLDEKNTICSAEKKKYVEINDKKVRAGISLAPDGGVDIFVHEFPGAPEIEPFGNTLNINVNIPLADKEDEIFVGYLTAAYLFWFKQFGYSWALQDHLNIVRQQMDQPSEIIIAENYLYELTENISPCIGVLIIDDCYIPASAIYDQIVYFPTASGLITYELINEKLSSAKEVTFKPISLFKSHEHPEIMALLYKDTFLMFPENFRRGVHLISEINGDITQNSLYIDTISNPKS